jgi:rhamnulose-1-phosphate aldolase
MTFESTIKDISKMCVDAGMRFMHPWASGNVSVVCDDIPTALSRDDAWKEMGVTLPNLRDKTVLISTAGSHKADIPDEPEQALGLVEVSSDGSMYRQIWGFKGFKQRPTSELDAHARILNLEGRGAVIHDHPPATNAMMFAGYAMGEREANRIIWQGSTEGIAYLPGGLAFIDWCVPGTAKLGEETAKKFAEGYDGVLWDRHGLVTHAADVRAAYGKVQTIEHAMQTMAQALAVVDIQPKISWEKESLEDWTNPEDAIRWLSGRDLANLVKTFGLKPNKQVWSLLFWNEPGAE